MTQIATQTIGVSGAAPSFAAAASGDTAEIGDGKHFYLEVKNTNAATRDVTIAVTTGTKLNTGATYPDRTYTVAANTGELRIPLVKEYRDATDGLAHITWSATSGVTRAVVRY